MKIFTFQEKKASKIRKNFFLSKFKSFLIVFAETKQNEIPKKSGTTVCDKRPWIIVTIMTIFTIKKTFFWFQFSFRLCARSLCLFSSFFCISNFMEINWIFNCIRQRTLFHLWGIGYLIMNHFYNETITAGVTKILFWLSSLMGVA